MAPRSKTSAPPVKLLAFDAEDLAVLSAKFQDAIVRVADMAFLERERRFALLAARFDWASAEAGRLERCSSGISFEFVQTVSQVGIPQDSPAAVLNLLAIAFRGTDEPAGEITLTFSGGAAIRLQVECIEAQMRDMGPRWRTRSQPGHPVDKAAAETPASRKSAAAPSSPGRERA